MVVGKDDLGLSLSLACSNPTNTPINNNNQNNHNMNFLMMMNKNNNNQHHHQTTPSCTTTTTTNNNNNNNTSPPLQLNLMMTSPSNSTPPFIQKLPWYRDVESFPTTQLNCSGYATGTGPSTDTCRSFLRGIDVNRPSGGVSGEEDPGVSSPNSTVSTESGKRSSSERDSASASAGVGDEIDDEDGGENSRKKLRLTKDQSAILEESFKEHSTLNPKQKQALAKRLGLRARQVEVWFQNRRARTKLKQTEVDCEFLKGCCEKLTEENRRLQKEVHELRTLKLSPQFYMQMTPPTTLTMCPSCERVAAPQAQVGLDSKSNIRPMPVNMWATAPVPVSVRPFDAFRPRS